MSEPYLELWPPPPEEQRRLMRRTSGMLAVVFAVVGLVVMAAVAIALFSRGVDLVSKAPIFLGASAGMAVLFGVVALLVGFFSTRQLGKTMERGREMIAFQLDEEIQTYCFAAFLGKRVYQPGMFFVTNQRLVRSHGTARGYKQAVLAKRSEVQSIARTQRHAMRGTVRAMLLKSQGVDEGLTITTTDGRTHFLVVAEMFLDRLFPWLEAQGFPCDHRTDADLEQRPQVSEVEFEDHRDPKIGRRNLRILLVPIGLSLFSMCLVGTSYLVDRRRRANNPIRSRFLKLNTVPPLKNQVVYIFDPATGSWKQQPGGSSLPPGKQERVGDLLVMLPGSSMEYYRLVRIDGVPYLHITSPPPDNPVAGDQWVTGWEPIGAPSDSDGDLLELAGERLEGP